MHYHLEVIIPPVEDIELSISQVLTKFNRTYLEEYEIESLSHPFFDYYLIGGRWSGVKLEHLIDKDKKDRFQEELKKREITVSSVQFGKPTLDPVEQIPVVDALWNEFFPDFPIKACPFFDHFDNQCNQNALPLKDTPKSLKASHVIIAAPHWRDADKLEAKYMIQDEMYNGVNFVSTPWDGLVISAIDMYKKDKKGGVMPQDDWLVVTVDYHS